MSGRNPVWLVPLALLVVLLSCGADSPPFDLPADGDDLDGDRESSEDELPDADFCEPDPCNDFGTCRPEDGACMCDSPNMDESCSECRQGYANFPACDRCAPGFVGYPDCVNLLTWVPIPGGTFQMGCVPQDTLCTDTEIPRHTRFIPAFEMTQTPITQDQYHAITGENPSRYGPNGREMDCGGSCPVEGVNWHDAKAFCEAVGGRLPSEAEWEYAARAGTETIYICGDDPACLDDVACWKRVDEAMRRLLGPCPVAERQPNAFGLYDMIGNVRAWVADCWRHDYEGAPDARPPCGGCVGHYTVSRGTGFNAMFASSMRLSKRGIAAPDLGFGFSDGIRCVRGGEIREDDLLEEDAADDDPEDTDPLACNAVERKCPPGMRCVIEEWDARYSPCKKTKGRCEHTDGMCPEGTFGPSLVGIGEICFPNSDGSCLETCCPGYVCRDGECQVPCGRCLSAGVCTLRTAPYCIYTHCGEYVVDCSRPGECCGNMVCCKSPSPHLPGYCASPAECTNGHLEKLVCEPEEGE